MCVCWGVGGGAHTCTHLNQAFGSIQEETLFQVWAEITWGTFYRWLKSWKTRDSISIDPGGSEENPSRRHSRTQEKPAISAGKESLKRKGYLKVKAWWQGHSGLYVTDGEERGLAGTSGVSYSIQTAGWGNIDLLLAPGTKYFSYWKLSM